LLFTTKAEPTALYKALSVEFKDRVLLGEAKKAETALAEKFGVTTFPTLLLFPKDSEEPIKFEGS
jgi:protein disulfide-isomerase A6